MTTKESTKNFTKGKNLVNIVEKHVTLIGLKAETQKRNENAKYGFSQSRKSAKKLPKNLIQLTACPQCGQLEA